MRWLRESFSFEGRIGRGAFLKQWVILHAIVLVCVAARSAAYGYKNIETALIMSFIPLGFAYAWAYWAVLAKRIRDTGGSMAGGFVLCGLFPPIGLAALSFLPSVEDVEPEDA